MGANRCKHRIHQPRQQRKETNNRNDGTTSPSKSTKDNGRNCHRKDERETVSHTNHGLHVTNQHQGRTNGTSMETRSHIVTGKQIGRAHV